MIHPVYDTAYVHFHGAYGESSAPVFSERNPQRGFTYGLTQMLLVLPVMYINRKFYQVGFKTLFKGSPNMDSLIAIGSGAAFVYEVFAIYRMGYGLGVQESSSGTSVPHGFIF